MKCSRCHSTRRYIFYAPDFLINAGGIINVYAELAHYDRAEIMRKTENIYNTTLEILILHLPINHNTSGSFDDSSKQN
jgi:leucine dehydrogenase